ncbi:sulfite exporter TauE/SafE family protein [Alteromonas sp. KUL49]|uniref:sulfite exporter TauE/SafE family protein n=1 Tax=Alteromonas sp. KUL49 TaxID=2480798 RepID=UPI00102F050F|nr:sulfite exporter TauE/SafE family protein [Alteromonas sp. KUL49]TAP42387.1 sulfite exporter TauE/SafE family protein [Alteromonas sp. KUL49]GEA10005.1 membrane protein [Alteromonas sp. KUL49]
MLDVDLILLLGLVSIATLIQSLTGFGFGLLVMSTFTAFNLLPITSTALLVCVLSVFNSLELAYRGRHHVDGITVKRILIAAFPSILVGFWLLEWLSSAHISALKLTLGMCILVATGLLLVKKSVKTQQSAPFSFYLAGSLGGLLGGLFATSGPPVVYHLYRQPWELEQIKCTLLMVFSISATTRILLVPFGTWPELTTLYTIALGIPVVIVSTRLARKVAPKVNIMWVRKSAIVLLMLSGVSLVSTAG